MKTIYSFLLLNILCLTTFAASGDIDLTFNGTGRVITEIANSAVAYDTAVQKDGKIVAVGRSVDVLAGTNFDFSAVRYNLDGLIDTTFANNGKFVLALSQSDDQAFKVKIQGNGKILLAGYSSNATFSGSNISVVRLNSDGLPDSSFGTNGVVRLLENSPVGLASNGGRLEIIETKQGKILVGGTVFLEEGVSTQAAIFSLNVDGSYNTAFRGDGKLLEPSLLSGSFLDFALTSESNIFVLSRTQFGGYILSSFEKNGEINTHVANGNGFVFVTQNPNLNFSNLEIQKKSDVFVSGTASFTGTSGAIESDLFVYKYDRKLDLDTSFGIFGQTQISIFPVDSLADVEVQNNGKILLLGSGINPVTNLRSASLVRFDENGILDFSFNSAGSTPGIVIADNINPYALTISRNKVIIAGDVFAARRSFALARYLLR